VWWSSKLELPSDVQVHPVFHVNGLKEMRGAAYLAVVMGNLEFSPVDTIVLDHSSCISYIFDMAIFNPITT